MPSVASQPPISQISPIPPIVSQEPEKPKEEPKPVVETPVPVIPEPTINIEPVVPPQPSPPTTPPAEAEAKVGTEPAIDSAKQVEDSELNRRVDEKLKVALDDRRLKANEARKTKQQEHLQAIEKLVNEKKEITNQDVRDLTHVSQSTATEYLSMLVKSGTIKMQGKGKATVYKNIFG